MKYLHIDVYLYKICESQKGDVPANTNWKGFYRKDVCECILYVI